MSNDSIGDWFTKCFENMGLVLNIIQLRLYEHLI